MSVADRLKEKLTAALAPLVLEILDESDRHIGHAGHRPEGETHFRVRIVSARFEGLSRLERQRAVHALLAPELAAGLHALSLDLKTPGEAGL